MKCFKGKLVPWITWLPEHKLKVYSLHLEGEKDCEAEKFYINFEDSEEFKEDLDTITAVINELLQSGAREGRFRPEGPVHAIPREDCKLRFYCVRINSSMLVLGNGGIKTSQKSQDSPDCEPHRLLMVAFENEFRRKIQDGELGWDHSNQLIVYLKNGLHFELGDCE